MDLHLRDKADTAVSWITRTGGTPEEKLLKKQDDPLIQELNNIGSYLRKANHEIDKLNERKYQSYDGGLTYPTSILATTTNDGTELITIPAGITTTARIMVRGSNNIFFDINDSDFEVQIGIATFSMSLDPSSIEECNTSDVLINVNTNTFMA